jgi:hypothetical protein
MGRDRYFLGLRPATTLLEPEVTGRVSSRTSRIMPHIVPRDGFYCEESWSEWQDLLFLCVTTDFLGLFRPVLFVCVPLLCT